MEFEGEEAPASAVWGHDVLGVSVSGGEEEYHAYEWG